MILRTQVLLAAIVAIGAVVLLPAARAQPLDVTGAWIVTITLPSGEVSGLAILSQDGSPPSLPVIPSLSRNLPERSGGGLVQ